jgi:diguanylate cyclase (GGDEF)-like protein
MSETDGADAPQEAAGVPSEQFSSVIVSNAGVPVDASLSRTASLRLLGERQRAFDLLLEKSRSTIFTFDVAEDVFYFTRMTGNDQCARRRICRFREMLEMSAHGRDLAWRRLAEALLAALEQPAGDVIELRGQIFFPEVHWCRVFYRSTAGADGRIESIVGCCIDVDAHHQDRKHHLYDPAAQLLRGTELVDAVNDGLQHLSEGGKGTMFLISLNNFVEILDANPSLNVSAYIQAMTESILSDFRGEDILGRVSDDAFVLFLCGHTSLDIIERRAERVIELVRRANRNGFENIEVSVGVAATSSPLTSFGTLYEEAENALKQAQERGRNNYRVYFAHEQY